MRFRNVKENGRKNIFYKTYYNNYKYIAAEI